MPIIKLVGDRLLDLETHEGRCHQVMLSLGYEASLSKPLRTKHGYEMAVDYQNKKDRLFATNKLFLLRGGEISKGIHTHWLDRRDLMDRAPRVTNQRQIEQRLLWVDQGVDRYLRLRGNTAMSA